MGMDMTTNILSVFRRATLAHCDEGMDWYAEAHVLASDWTHGDVLKGAGVIAAYSPLMPWWRNVILARESLLTGVASTKARGTSVRAAQRILDGENALDVLKGEKTNSFCRNIVAEGKSDIVTIDVHAFSIAMGEAIPSSKIRGLGKARYAEIANCYREAADAEQLYPAQLQAITWVAWRDGVRP
jgi:hypothetical protein